jgi:hypothetical protein
MDRVEQLAAETAIAKEEEKFLTAKAKYFAGETNYKTYRKAKEKFSFYRMDLRVLDGREPDWLNERQQNFHEARWAKADK